MAVPYEFPYVQQYVGPRLRIVGDEQETRENSFKAVNDACIRIRAEKDDGWGLLKKTGGANAFGYAADVWLYNLRNGTAQVVDVVGNSEGAPPPEGGPRGTPVCAWGEADIRQISEWAPPVEPPYEDSEPSPEPVPPPSSDLDARVTALEEVVTSMGAELDEVQAQLIAIDQRLDAIDQRFGRLRTHGPVDLPCVIADITHLRAKGDIDVPVQSD